MTPERLEEIRDFLKYLEGRKDLTHLTATTAKLARTAKALMAEVERLTEESE